MFDDIEILISLKIIWENWPLHSEELFENILLAYGHMVMTDLLWPLNYMALTLLALLCMYLVSLTQLYIYHLRLSLSTLSCYFSTHYFCYVTLISIYCFRIIYTKSHIVLHLHWLMKLTKSGLLGETIAGKIQGGVLGKTAPLRALPYVILLFIRAPVITCYIIPEYSELFLPAIMIH